MTQFGLVRRAHTRIAADARASLADQAHSRAKANLLPDPAAPQYLSFGLLFTWPPLWRLQIGMFVYCIPRHLRE